jgi:hypothetical protein
MAPEARRGAAPADSHSARRWRWLLKHTWRRYYAAAGTGRPTAVRTSRGLRCRARGAVSTSPIAKLLTQFPATLIRQGLKIPESLS